MWMTGLLRRRPGRLLAAAACIAVAVSLIVALGGFLGASKATMTGRAARAVAVDWQIAVQPGADARAVLTDIRTHPGVRVADPVGFGDALALTSSADGHTQTTGPAVIVGVPDHYRQHFPDMMRTLSGADTGVLLAQQTASNLRAAPGSTVTIHLPGGTTATEHVDGIVELPQSDSLFRTVGATSPAQPPAPPDNVLLMPIAEFDAVFAPTRTVDPAVVRTQVHVSRDRTLPPDPAQAYGADAAQARHLEATLAGAGIVGDNLGATLDAARQDALYSQVLFLFLGLPGVALAAALAAVVTAGGALRRRQEQGLLRARGATTGQITALAGIEAAAVAVVGGAVGIGLGMGVQHAISGTTVSLTWALVAIAAGMVIAVGAVVVPAVRDLRSLTVLASRADTGRFRPPLWRRIGLDFIALAAAFLVYRTTGRAGYTLVLAPEGVTSLSVSYWAFVGPALLWIGAGLITLRLVDLVLTRGGPVIRILLHPWVGPLSGTVSSMLSRRRTALGRAAALVALAGVFAVSTAVFNSTYRQQAEVDARLTNGADVTVTEPPASTVGADFADRLGAIPGVRGVEPIEHRFAYVGTEVQDLYGVDPTTVTRAAQLQDAYFDGGTADELIAALSAHTDGVLVSAETVSDFQLTPGDMLNLRLYKENTDALTTVPFRFVGVVKEFPTAPKDSFLVANSAYIAEVTGSPAVGAFLVDTGGVDTAQVRTAVAAVTGTGAVVTDITTARGAVGTTLTSVDLSGLTRLELAYAVALAAAGASIVLGLGFSERRRTFAIVTVLGGTRRHTASLILSEAAVVTVVGATVGAVGGGALSGLLVTVLRGVFDPPPAALAVPWAYLLLVTAVTVAAIATVTAVSTWAAAHYPISALRE
ncbi:FtsX-like permease family protein [Rhodococcus wratislaviensis]|nr:FtsX-like permease family protein [Rhodococcus sp. 3A]MBC2897749.1 FtsX-like permease family protein [Rhodococcus sp. 4CII]